MDAVGMGALMRKHAEGKPPPSPACCSSFGVTPRGQAAGPETALPRLGAWAVPAVWGLCAGGRGRLGTDHGSQRDGGGSARGAGGAGNSPRSWAEGATGRCLLGRLLPWSPPWTPGTAATDALLQGSLLFHPRPLERGAGYSFLRPRRPGQGEGLGCPRRLLRPALDTWPALGGPWAFGLGRSESPERAHLSLGPSWAVAVGPGWACCCGRAHAPGRLLPASTELFASHVELSAVLGRLQRASLPRMQPVGVHSMPGAVKRFPRVPSAPPVTGLRARSDGGTELEGGSWVQGPGLPRQEPQSTFPPQRPRSLYPQLRMAPPLHARAPGAPSGCPARACSWRGARLLGVPGLPTCV